MAITVNIVFAGMQMKGQVAIPSTTIIELSSETAVFPSSLLVFHFLIYFMKFALAGVGSCPVFIYSANLNADENFAASKEVVPPCFIKWKLHVDEKAVQERSRYSSFKWEQMTTHMFLQSLPAL